jgi:hypothetical protein
MMNIAVESARKKIPRYQVSTVWIGMAILSTGAQLEGFVVVDCVSSNRVSYRSSAA